MDLLSKMASKVNKTLVMSAIRCPKRAWMRIHKPSKGEEPSGFLIGMGERLQKFAPSYFGLGRDLSEIRNKTEALAATYEAMCEPEVDRIYEATFEADGVLVRVDVLQRAEKGSHVWDMIEIKSSSTLRDDHMYDLAVQKFVVVKDGSVDLRSAYLANINKDFILPEEVPGDTIRSRYDGFFQFTKYSGDNPEDGDMEQIRHGERIKFIEEAIDLLIRGILPADSPCPDMPVGSHCTKPFPCEFKKFCESELDHHAEVPIRIVPRIGRQLSEFWAKKGVYDLREVDRSSLKKPSEQRLWRAHKEDHAIRSKTCASRLRQLPWPRYSMDFETVQQVVPIMAGSKPRDALPFQWSVHVWPSAEEVPELHGGESFLSFDTENLHRRFAETLLASLGTEGPIFVHSIAAERGVLKKLMAHPSCADLKKPLKAIEARLFDTLSFCRTHFYAPQQMGSYSLKAIVKGIPHSQILYDDGSSVGNGQDAQLAWFVCNTPETSQKTHERLREDLVKYCAKDTFALIELVQHLSLDDEAFVAQRASIDSIHIRDEEEEFREQLIELKKEDESF